MKMKLNSPLRVFEKWQSNGVGKFKTNNKKIILVLLPYL